MARNFSHPGRSAVRAQHGMVSTSHPIASAIGLEMLLEGGSAVDAAIAASAVLTIAEPHMTGIGGDCFALVGQDGSEDITAINGSGPAPKGITLDALTTLGLSEIPRHSPHAVTVPGAVGAWYALHQRFGKLDWDRIMSPALDYATHGMAVHDRVARDWALNTSNISEDADAAQQYLNNGQAYQPGEIFRQPQLAKALKAIIKDGAEGFYKGPVAEDMVAKLQALGGFHTEQDFSQYQAQFVTPISADYKGYTIWECPPNGQGVAALILIRMLEHFDLSSLNAVDQIHVLAEASKIAYHLRDTYVADPEHSSVPVDWLLADDQIQKFVSIIDMNKAQDFGAPDFPNHPHTVYLCAVDKDGMAISFINSIFDDFGSGISTPNFGVLMQSRGRAFSLQSGHANVIDGGKRPFHTIIPGMLTQNQRIIGPFGVMGGQYQATGHGMLMSNLFDLGMNPQQALDAARSFAHAGVLQLEDRHGDDVAKALQAKGHKLDYPSKPLGGGQAILRDLDTGVYTAGSDPRKDGSAIGY